jgi:polysulfide reductase chain B
MYSLFNCGFPSGMCWDRVHVGEKPVCAEVCLTEAIRFGVKELLTMQLNGEGKEILKKMSAQSVLYFRTPK